MARRHSGQEDRRRRALARLQAQTYEQIAGKYEDEMRLDDLPNREQWDKRRNQEIRALHTRLNPHAHGNEEK